MLKSTYDNLKKNGKSLLFFSHIFFTIFHEPFSIIKLQTLKHQKKFSVFFVFVIYNSRIISSLFIFFYLFF